MKWGMFPLRSWPWVPFQHSSNEGSQAKVCSDTGCVIGKLNLKPLNLVLNPPTRGTFDPIRIRKIWLNIEQRSSIQDVHTAYLKLDSSIRKVSHLLQLYD
jgi:hypothetical protein